MQSPQSFELDFNVQLDLRDQGQIDAYANLQGLVVAEFLRQADEYDVDSQPVPHVHTPHQELADRSYWGTLFAHGGGLAVAVAWSALTATSLVLGTIAGAVLYGIVAVTLDLSMTAYWPRKPFMRLYGWMLLPAMVLLVPSATALLMARFADPGLAKTLTQFDPYAWTALESSLLILGALAFTAQRRFGWSGSLTRRYEDLEKQITVLKHAIRRRAQRVSQNAVGLSHAIAQGKSSSLPVVLLLAGGLSILMAPSAQAACPLAVVDQTGSIANQQAAEQHLIVLLAKHSGKASCIGVMPVSAHVFSAERQDVRFENPRPSLFQSVQNAFEQTRQEDAERKLRVAFQERLPVAPCTSITDMLMLAAQQNPALLLSDGEHTCGSPAGPVLSTSQSVVVVLVRSVHDSGSDMDVFNDRKAMITKRLPNAHVLPEFQMDYAVQLFFEIAAEAPSRVANTF